jgi:hypothetical protein
VSTLTVVATMPRAVSRHANLVRLPPSRAAMPIARLVRR